MNINILQMLIISLVFQCCNIGTNEMESYSKTKESFETEYGKAIYSDTIYYDTVQKEFSFYKIIDGNRQVFIYDHYGTAVIEHDDYDTKYHEILIFQMDFIEKDFKYCDTTGLSKLRCQYFWMAFGEKLRSKIIDIDKGCIKGKVSNDTLDLSVNISTDFEFGGFLREEKNKQIKLKATCIIKNDTIIDVIDFKRIRVNSSEY